MILYTVLNIITIILVLVAIFLIVVEALTEIPTMMWVALVMVPVIIGCGFWANHIKETNTTVSTEIVQTVVTEKEFSHQVYQGLEKIKHYLFTDSGHRVEVSEEEYATILKGDTVEIEVTHVETFGKVTKEAKLKERN